MWGSRSYNYKRDKGPSRHARCSLVRRLGGKSRHSRLVITPCSMTYVRCGSLPAQASPA